MAALEQKKSYFVAKDFKGINVTNNRTAIGEGEFAWMENAQPIGFGNVKIVNAPDTQAGVTFANTVSYMASANINNTEFQFAFQENGSAQYVNIENNTLGNLATSGTFSNSNVQIVQWKNERILIIDPNNGYKTWDGTNLVDIGSIGTITINDPGTGYSNANVSISAPDQTGGVPAAGEVVLLSNTVAQVILTEPGTGYTSPPTITINDPTGSNANVTCTLFNQSGTGIATFSGRAWISEERTVYYTAVDKYNDFINVSSGFITLTDSTLRTNIATIIAANNFLYIFGEDSINVFSDVRVNSVTGETLFTNTNVSASIGSGLNTPFSRTSEACCFSIVMVCTPLWVQPLLKLAIPSTIYLRTLTFLSRLRQVKFLLTTFCALLGRLLTTMQARHARCSLFSLTANGL